MTQVTRRLFAVHVVLSILELSFHCSADGWQILDICEKKAHLGQGVLMDYG